MCEIYDDVPILTRAHFQISKQNSLCIYIIIGGRRGGRCEGR